MKNFRPVGTAVLAVFFAGFCFGNAAHAKVVDRIVAVVNGDIITQSDVDARTNAIFLPSARAKDEAKTSENRDTALDTLINDLLLDQAVEQAKVEVTDEDVQRAVQNILAQNRMSLDQLQTEVAKKGMSYEQYVEQIKKEIRKIKYVNQFVSTEVKISDRDLREYFENNRTSIGGGKEAHIAEIVLPVMDIKTEEEAIALRDRALDIVKQSRARTGAFENFAKQYSKGPNAETGGDLGTVKLSDLPTRVSEYVKNMPAGTVSDPIPTDNAVIIVKVIEWPNVASGDFEAVRDTIYQKLYDERLKEALEGHLQKIRQTAYIEKR